MTKKEITEIRRRLNPERNNISVIRGCYVNQKGEIISRFSHSPLMLPQSDAEKYMAIFSKTLSGTPDKNLINVEFTPEQVSQGEEHRRLMALRDSALTDDEAVEAFFENIVSTIEMEDNYLILLMHDAYDVPTYTADGASLEDGSAVFHYIICSVCPVKLNKPALRWDAQEGEFRARELDWIVGAPQLGFMFPCFDQRTANIYASLYYLKDPSKPHAEFTGAMFAAQDMPMSAEEQRMAFQSLLEETLEEECDYDVVQSMHQQLSDRIKEHKADKEAEPLTVGRSDMRNMLMDSGVSPERVEAFSEQYETRLGAGVDLSPVNIVEPSQFKVNLPDVVIKVAPQRSDLIETRVIDGRKYILILAEEGVQVNGVNIAISDEADKPF